MNEAEAVAVKDFQCVKCRAVSALVDTVKERTLRAGVIEVYLECVACGDIVHVYFDSEGLRAQAKRVQESLDHYHKMRVQAAGVEYQTRRAAYKRAFDDHNHRWRRKLGMYAKEG